MGALYECQKRTILQKEEGKRGRLPQNIKGSAGEKRNLPKLHWTGLLSFLVLFINQHLVTALCQFLAIGQSDNNLFAIVGNDRSLGMPSVGIYQRAVATYNAFKLVIIKHILSSFLKLYKIKLIDIEIGVTVFVLEITYEFKHFVLCATISIDIHFLAPFVDGIRNGVKRLVIVFFKWGSV